MRVSDTCNPVYRFYIYMDVKSRQRDCPEDADTYIHRVGRTARYERAGKAVLFLDPSEEEGMLKRLEHKKVPIQKTKPRQKKQQSIQKQLQNMCFQDPEL